VKVETTMALMMINTRQYERGFQFILFPRDDYKLHSEASIDLQAGSKRPNARARLTSCAN